MELTAENVHLTVMKCLFAQDEDHTEHVIGQGVKTEMGFHPERLEFQRDTVKGFLDQLPDTFRVSGGGGQSFLNMCMCSDGRQWGEHTDMDALCALGNALELVVYPMPKDMWHLLPGGMPYVTYKDVVKESE